MNRLVVTAIAAVTLVGVSAGAHAAPVFNQENPLAAPADGEVYAYLDSGWFQVGTGVVFQPFTSYTITSAVGRAIGGDAVTSGSIQAWSGAGFIGQEYSGTGTWASAAEGEWADNSFAFDSTFANAEAGEELTVLVTNYHGPSAAQAFRAYFDNFRVYANDELVWSSSFEVEGLDADAEGELADAGWWIPDPLIGGLVSTTPASVTAIPEPASAALLSLGGLLMFRRSRR
ncbi:MAG: PEP-CTERM sorting domain-containing protein [Phycisphaeraceae bacterium]